MKTIKQLNRDSIISFPDNYVELVSHDINGEIEYDFCVILDQRKLFRANSKSLRVSLRPNETKFLQKINVNEAPTVVLRQIENKNSDEKAIDRENTNQIFKQFFIDLDTVLDTSAISTNSVEIGELRDYKKLKVVKKMDIDDKSTPIYQKTVITNVSPKNAIDNLSRDVIEKQGLDPSDIVENNFLIKDREAFSGLISKSQKTVRVDNFSNFDEMNGIILSRPLATNNSGVKEQDYVVVSEKESSNLKKAYKRIKFSAQGVDIDEHFYVTFEILNKKGVTIERYERKILHGKNMLEYLKPKIEPLVKASSISEYKNIFQITQRDPHARFINIYNKVLNPNMDNIDCPYRFVDQIELQQEDGEAYWEDDSIKSATSIYRFIAADSNGNNSGAFYNVVAKNSLRINKIRKLDNFAVISTVNTNAGLQVDVKSIPAGYQTVSVKRVLVGPQKTTEEFLTNEEGYKIIDVSGNKQTASFIDSNLKEGRVYEYFAILTTKDGYAVTANPSKVVEYKKFIDGFIDLFVDTAIVTEESGQLNVSFRLQSNITESGIKAVKDLLSRKGMLDFYSSEIENDKEFAEGLIAHKISRQDTDTGEESHFNVFHGTYFSDKDNRASSGVSELVPGRSYQYKVVSLLRNPLSLFRNRTESFSRDEEIQELSGDGSGLGTTTGTKSLSVDMYKFSHPIALQGGSILIPGSESSIHAKKDFEFGATGTEKVFDVTMDIPLPALSSPRAEKVADRIIKITWDSIGDREKIDHYLIVLVVNNQEEIVGRTHALSDSDRIEYYHVLEKEEIAFMRYRIIPVFLDYNHGLSEITPGIIIQ